MKKTENSTSPKALQPGDCIGIVAPAGQLRDQESLSNGVAILTEMGFKVKLPRCLWPGSGYLADSDSNRALEFHKMWVDPEVSALLALRGGFGSLRLLPFWILSRFKRKINFLSDFPILRFCTVPCCRPTI